MRFIMNWSVVSYQTALAVVTVRRSKGVGKHALFIVYTDFFQVNVSFFPLPLLLREVSGTTSAPLS